MFADRCVEMTMENIRKPLGKKVQAGMQVKVETTLTLLDKQAKNNFELNELLGHNHSYAKENWNDRKGEVAAPFVETFKWCMKLNLYREGPIAVATTPESSSSNNNDIEQSDEIFMTPKGEVINSAMMKCWSLGTERAKKYYEKSFTS